MTLSDLTKEIQNILHRHTPILQEKSIQVALKKLHEAADEFVHIAKKYEGVKWHELSELREALSKATINSQTIPQINERLMKYGVRLKDAKSKEDFALSVSPNSHVKEIIKELLRKPGDDLREELVRIAGEANPNQSLNRKSEKELQALAKANAIKIVNIKKTGKVILNKAATIENFMQQVEKIRLASR